ncbi:hypothetical protein H8959_016677 [Pygathrix nigripes]
MEEGTSPKDMTGPHEGLCLAGHDWLGEAAGSEEPGWTPHSSYQWPRHNAAKTGAHGPGMAPPQSQRLHNLIGVDPARDTQTNPGHRPQEQQLHILPSLPHTSSHSIVPSQRLNSCPEG